MKVRGERARVRETEGGERICEHFILERERVNKKLSFIFKNLL